MKPYCIAYTRVSSKKQKEQGLSLEAQEEIIRDYAKKEMISQHFPLSVMHIWSQCRDQSLSEYFLLDCLGVNQL